MTRTELLTALDALTPTQRRTVLAAALSIRVAREAGDLRPAVAICAPMLTLTHRPAH